jgi:uncharacterized PurR-regulated membrane protein YhhQ (DUF165 family)
VTGKEGRLATAAWVVTFIACVALANWAIVCIGADNGDGGPRTLPIGFGLHAPSGVIFAGAVLTVRDMIHERLGTVGVLAVIAASAPVTALTSTQSLAIASVVTFAIAEIADLLVYERMRERGRLRAVIVSNTASSVLDSAVFLALAFGADAAIAGAPGMTIGKVGASALTLALIEMFRTLAIPRRASRTRLGARLAEVEPARTE